MTCVWDAFLAGIPRNIISQYLHNINPIEFVKLLQSNNKKTNNIIINNAVLSQKEIEENYDAIQNFNVNSIYGGYLCSTSDPFFILLCDIFQCSIHHNYINNLIKYEITNPKFTLHLHSSHSHMSFIKTI